MLQWSQLNRWFICQLLIDGWFTVGRLHVVAVTLSLQRDSLRVSVSQSVSWDDLVCESLEDVLVLLGLALYLLSASVSFGVRGALFFKIFVIFLLYLSKGAELGGIDP